MKSIFSNYLNDIKKIDKKNIFIFGGVLFFFVYSLFFVGPLNLYIPNADELAFGLKDVITSILPTSLIVILMLLILYLLLSNKYKILFILLLFGIGFALYLQGNFFSFSFGSSVLDGTPVEWTNYFFPAIINFLVWLIIVFLPISLYYILKKNRNVLNYVLIASLFLSAIQIPAMIVQLLSYAPKEESSLIIKRDKMFNLSKDENIIVFILDQMDERFYEEFISNNPEYKDSLDGFVHYDNVLAGGARTMMAMPIIFTGQPYDEYDSYSEYVSAAFSKENIMSTLKKVNYDVRVYSEPLFFPIDIAEDVDNFATTNNVIKSKFILTKKLYKVTFYKYFPIVFKPFLWFDTSEFNQALSSSEEYSTNDIEFNKELTSNGIVTDNHKKVFVLYHLLGAHPPFSMNEKAEKEEGSSLQKQVAGSFKIVLNYLEQLKASGVYDNSTIILTADHGDYSYAQHPFMLVKQKNQKGSYVDSSKPLSSFDIPVYVCDVAGAKLDNQQYGLNINDVKDDMVRERHLFNNQSKSSKMFVNEYITTSTARDYDSLTRIKIYEQNTIYTLGKELSFQIDNTANRYTVEGFGYTTGYRTKLRGPIDIMEIPFDDIPQKEEISCHISLHSLSNAGYKMIIKTNDIQVYENVIDKSIIKEGISFKIPTSVFDGNKTLRIEFLFPEISQDEMNRESSKRTETVSFKTIVFE